MQIYNWYPDLYRNKSEAPEEIHDVFNPNLIGVKCFGVHDADKEHIGHLKYYPEAGFPFVYYPYLNQQRYKSPLVFVQFESATPGVVIMVKSSPF